MAWAFLPPVKTFEKESEIVRTIKQITEKLDWSAEKGKYKPIAQFISAKLEALLSIWNWAGFIRSKDVMLA